MRHWEQIDRDKCKSAFNDASESFKGMIEDGEQITEADFRGLRKEYAGTKGDYHLNAKEADSVISALRKEFQPAATDTAAAAGDSPSMPADVTEEDWIADPELPGYAIDAHNRVKDIQGGQGRKIGNILTLVQTWVNTGKKGAPKKFQFRMYYQIRVNGKRTKLPYYQVGIRRNKLARERHYPKCTTSNGQSG